MAKKVLIIEDIPTEAAIIKQMISDSGIEVEIALTGEEGLQKTQEFKPDLILLDLELPDISGFQVCKEIMESTQREKPLIVVLSASDDSEEITKAFSMGADDYIIKIPNPEFLVRKIKLYLGIYEKK